MAADCACIAAVSKTPQMDSEPADCKKNRIQPPARGRINFRSDDSIIVLTILYNPQAKGAGFSR
jgi:hypothetical protein